MEQLRAARRRRGGQAPTGPGAARGLLVVARAPGSRALWRRRPGTGADDSRFGDGAPAVERGRVIGSPCARERSSVLLERESRSVRALPTPVAKSQTTDDGLACGRIIPISPLVSPVPFAKPCSRMSRFRTCRPVCRCPVNPVDARTRRATASDEAWGLLRQEKVVLSSNAPVGGRLSSFPSLDVGSDIGNSCSTPGREIKTD